MDKRHPVLDTEGFERLTLSETMGTVTMGTWLLGSLGLTKGACGATAGGSCRGGM